MSELPLAPAVFVILAQLIEEKTGLHFKPGDAELLAGKMSPRVIEAGFDSFMDYYYFLRYDPAGPAELERLVDALVVGETYFFREADQLEVLVRDCLAPEVARGRRPRVWCAASASGEEPLTIAMLLDERGLLPLVEIVASDVSRRALEKAAHGDYGKRSLRDPPVRALGRWIFPEGDRARVDPRLRAAIRWERVNLVDEAAIARLGTFDAIVCRNVMIYFRDATSRRVASRLSDALRPGGVLLVGASESLLRLELPLICEERGGAFFYRKAPEDKVGGR